MPRISRKLEHADLTVGTLIEVKPKPNHGILVPGDLFQIVENTNYRYRLLNLRTGNLFDRGWDLTSIRRSFHKRLP
jgi:hypothetical protein